MTDQRIEIVLDEGWEGGGYFINSDGHRVAITQLPSLRSTIASLQREVESALEAAVGYRNDLIEAHAAVGRLEKDNLTLAKKVSALRKLNTAYRVGDQRLADAALNELEALNESQGILEQDK